VRICWKPQKSFVLGVLPLSEVNEECAKSNRISQYESVHQSGIAMHDPLVSIITPVLNGAGYIELCIQSVLCQSYPHIEHIIVDGGSSDGTVAIIASYASRYPGRIRFVSEPDNGVGDAWNKGLGIARGEILGWLGCDDTLYESDAIQSVVEFFRTTPDAYFVHGSVNYVDEHGAILSTHYTKEFTLDQLINDQSFIACTSAFYRRAVIEKVGELDEYGSDFDFMIRVAKAFRIYRVDKVLSCFRTHRGSQTTGSNMRLRRMWYRQYCIISRRHGGRFFSAHRKRYYRFIVYNHPIVQRLRPILRPIYRLINIVWKIDDIVWR